MGRSAHPLRRSSSAPRRWLARSLLAAAASTLALPAVADTLADAIAYAYQTNPGLQSQREALKALDESYVQARAGYGLQIGAQVSDEYWDQWFSGPNARFADVVPSTTSSAPHQAANNGAASLTVTQPIYTGGRVHSQLNEAEAGIMAGREGLRRVMIDLLTRVVQAYVNVLRDQALLKVDQDTVTVLEKEVSDTEARFNVREVTMTDVAESKARLAQARVQLANTMASLAVSRSTYQTTVGEPPGQLEEPPALEAVPSDVDAAFDSAENNNPLLLAAKYTEEKSRAKIDEAKAALKPTVSAQVSLSHNPYIPYQGGAYNNALAATVTLNQPIFTSGLYASQVRQAAASNASDRLGIDDARQQVVQAVSTAWEQLAAARSQITSFTQEVEADEFSFYGNREEAKLALRQTIDVLNAELELTQAQEGLIRARSTEYVARVQLLGAMGVLTPGLLSPGVHPYDPAANLRHVEHKGETPLEWPARALDALGQPKLQPPPPTTIDKALPAGSPMPPTPSAGPPIRSILSTIEKPPPEPK